MWIRLVRTSGHTGTPRRTAPAHVPPTANTPSCTYLAGQLRRLPLPFGGGAPALRRGVFGSPLCWRERWYWRLRSPHPMRRRRGFHAPSPRPQRRLTSALPRWIKWDAGVGQLVGRPRWAPHAVTTTARHEPFGRAVSPSPSAGRGLPHPPGAGTQKWCACLMMKCTTDAAKDSRHKERTTRLARVLRHSNECPRHDATATICTAGMHVIAWRQACLWMWTGLGLGLLVLHRCGAPHRTGAGRTMWRTWLLCCCLMVRTRM